jgi:hypothetical protein
MRNTSAILVCLVLGCVFVACTDNSGLGLSSQGGSKGSTTSGTGGCGLCIVSGSGGTTGSGGGASTGVGGMTSYGGGAMGMGGTTDGAGGKVGGFGGAAGSAGGSGGKVVGTGGSAGSAGGAAGGAGGVGGAAGGTGGTTICPAIACLLPNCPYGTVPSTSPCGCPTCAPAPDGGGDVGEMADAQVSCSPQSKCPNNMVCGFSIVQGCSALGACHLRPTPLPCNAIIEVAACGCDGKTINWTSGCSPSMPDGFAPAPVVHSGACP